MQQTKKLMGITSLMLGFFSLALTAIFILNYPPPVSEFSVEGFRQQYSGFPPTLPFVVVGTIAAFLSCRSGYGKLAMCVSTISLVVFYLLFIN